MLGVGRATGDRRQARERSAGAGPPAGDGLFGRERTASTRARCMPWRIIDIAANWQVLIKFGDAACARKFMLQP